MSSLNEENLRYAVLHAPIGICMLDAATLKAEIVNDKFLEVAGKPYETIFGQFYWDAFAEARVYYESALAGVVETGEAYFADEVELMLIRHGKEENIFVTFVYSPVKDKEGTVEKVAVWVLENTIQVAARQKIEVINRELDKSQKELQATVEELATTNEELAATNEELAAANEELHVTYENVIALNQKITENESKLKQAIDTGKMGTWWIDPTTLKISMSDFVKQLFGFPLNREPDMETVMKAVTPEYHQLLLDALDKAIKHHLPSDTEYSIINQVTGELKWVRATGRVFVDATGNATEYSGLFMDITERKLDELRKNDFIGMVSHELKTPLTSLTAIVQVANAKLKENPDTFLANAMQKANMQVKKMTSMINGFLNISRLESGKIQMHKTIFNLEAQIANVIAEAQIVSPGHFISFAPCDPIRVCADQDKIASVISNLLSNAVKYSPKSTSVEVCCKTREAGVEVSVSDKGFGIKPEDIKHLFDRYYRVDDPNYSHISGFGIGLYLSSEIIRQHDGEIWVDSIPGEGSTFYFSIPANL